ncbi:pyridoxal-phosphate dependent enzyme [Shewanella sp.]|uniref:pyridoxal-phosphate dependent enzyme n=1 Tax=Shewanella sp. TaxID=50422 RepID=UPI00356414F3
MNNPSPVEQISFFGRPLWLKRDDLLPEPFSGNKARKFAALRTGEFPEVNTLIGYGSPQSNSLFSLAALAHEKGWRLEFYVDHIATAIDTSPSGNYGGALGFGAQVLPVGSKGMSAREYVETVRLKAADRHQCLYVPEGGRCALAREGVRTLAAEICAWADNQDIGELRVFLPSGTGTTALYLNEYFFENAPAIEVFTCPVVGDDCYLKAQFSELIADPALHPKVVAGKHHYAGLKLTELEIWGQMLAQGTEFELLYDPCGLLVLRTLMQQEAGCDGHSVHWLYVHQGGLRGNVSMAARYRRKFGQWFEHNKAWAGKYL